MKTKLTQSKKQASRRKGLIFKFISIIAILILLKVFLFLSGYEGFLGVFDTTLHRITHIGKLEAIDNPQDIGKECFSGFQCDSGHCNLKGLKPSNSKGKCTWKSWEVGCSSKLHFGVLSSGICVDPF